MPPWRSDRADVIISAPLQGRLIRSIAVSMVTGRFMLKPDPTTTNYILYLLAPSFSSSRGCRGRELEGMINIFNLLLYNAAATSAALLPLLLYMNCWLILPPCCKTRRKMLVFDRLSYSLLPWYFYLAVHYTASPSI